MDDTETGMSKPTSGTAESAAWFKGTLAELGETQASMARLMLRNGDDRAPATVERHIRRMANGEARVSGEMRVVLTMLSRGKRKAIAREQATAAAG